MFGSVRQIKLATRQLFGRTLILSTVSYRIVSYLCRTEKLHHREVQLSSLVDYVKELEGWRLDGYDGDDVEYILHLLQHPQPGSSPGFDGPGTRNLTAVPRRNHSRASPTAYDGPATAWDGTDTHGSANDESPNVDLSHALHYASIGLLGLLVIEVRSRL